MTEIQKKIIIYKTLALLILIYSCTASKEEVKELDKIPVKEIKEKVNKNSELIESLEASGSISIDSPELSNSGSIEVRIKKPDSVLIKIEGPFGIDIITALITRNNFIYYNAQENKAIMGPTNETNIGAILKLKVGFDELLNSFSASFNFIGEQEDSLDAKSENNNYIIQIISKNGMKKFLIEPKDFFINKYGVYDNNSITKLEVFYSNYRVESISSGQINFPNQIKITKPDKEQTVWLYYESKTINKKNLSFKIKIPTSARIIKWE
ncbi:MAG: DUF4292 domain-containing protein [Ignavibacteria bacterium]